MKRAILYLMLPALLFYSCKKDHSAPSVKKYKVSYSLSGFTQQIIGSTASKQQVNSLKTNSNSAISSAINVLYYYLYNAGGDQVGAIYQDSTYSNFGNITDNLQAGTYTVIFVGGKAGLNITSYNTINTIISGYGQTSYPWKDTFFQKFTLTVSGGNVTQNVSMNRIVAELSIDILDKIPANAAKIVLTESTDYEYYSFKTAAPFQPITPRTTTFTLPAAVLGTTGYTQSIIMLNTITPFDVTIACYDAGNNPIGQATITNVSLAANTQTLLSGNLFGANSGFTTSLNHTWDPTTINYPF